MKEIKMGVMRDKGVIYKAVNEIDLGPNSDQLYLHADVKAPRMTGLLTKVFVWILEMKLVGNILIYFMKKNNRFQKLVSYVVLEESPLYVPLHPYKDFEEEEVKCLDLGLSPVEQVQHAMDCLQSSDTILQDSDFIFCRWTILDYSRAYAKRQITPLVVAERLISAVMQSSSPGMDMSFFISYDTQDILRQATESTLRHARGEPISVLDGVPIAVKDEIDCMPYPTTGSVRTPAALCGVIGLKPSFGRIPHTGVLPLNWTVGMVGVLAGTVEDSLIVYAAISGQAESHQPTMPRLHLPMLKPSNMSNIKLAKSNEWFNDCSDDIKVCCLRAIDSLHKVYGWETVEVTIPDIEAMRLAHYVTIGAECTTSIAHHLEKLGNSVSGWDVRVALSIYGSFNGRDYLNAQRIRNRQMRFHEKIFSMADVIVLPMVGVTTYEIKDDVQETGELDYINGAALVRYSIAGNFLGLPAVTVPVGYDKHGLPIGIQFIGKPWSEAKLIQIAYAMEALCKAEYKKPKVFYDILGES